MRSEWKTILVVDDEPADGELIKLAFREIGTTATIHCVSSGKEAIAYLNKEGRFSDPLYSGYPSCIITDLKMADGDGYLVLQHLKNMPDRRVIPTVVFSGSADPDDVKYAYLLGASCYLVKPGSYSELRRLLKTFHDFWTECAVPKMDETGCWLHTEGRGKLGERFLTLFKHHN